MVSAAIGDNDIVQELWNRFDALRDDGINYSGYGAGVGTAAFIKTEYGSAESGLLEEHKLPDYARRQELPSLSSCWRSHEIEPISSRVIVRD